MLINLLPGSTHAY